jgi:hypothetical protein
MQILLAFLVLLFGSAARAYACSMITLYAPLPDSVSFFLATATTDTVAAGPGDMTFSHRGGHRAVARTGPIFGQRVTLTRAGGAAAGLAGSAVVVGWDYDDSCQPVPFGGSARLVKPGTTALFEGTLRPREHWVDGRPTFDIQLRPQLPYTGTERPWHSRESEPLGEILPAELLFDVYEALPTRGSIEAMDTAVLPSLRAWARTNRSLVEHPVVRNLITSVAVTAYTQITRRATHPITGTWRFSVEAPGDTARVFYARSSSGLQRWNQTRTRFTIDPVELTMPAAQGYVAHLRTAPTLDSLPRTWAEAIQRFSETHSYGGSISVLATPTPDSAGRRHWRGFIEGAFLLAEFAHEPRLRAAADLDYQTLWGLEAYEERPYPTPLRLEELPDGRVMLRQVFALPGGGEVILTGERISRQEISGSR